MRSRRQRRRAVLLALVAVASAGLALVARATHATRRTELASVDARFSIRGARSAPRDVAIVGIDVKTLHTRGIPSPPLPRHLDAKVIDTLHRDGAKVIALDLDVTKPAPDPADDDALHAAVARAGNVVLVTAAPADKLNLGALRASRVAIGSPTFHGGVFRQLGYSSLGLRSFAVVVAQRAGHPTDRSLLAGDGAWIDYAGPAGTIPAISFADVLDGRVAPSKVRGRVVVIGDTDPLLLDIHTTSAGADMPGPEIEANAIDTLLRGVPLRGAAGWLTILLIVLAGAVVPAGALWLTGLRWLPVPVAFGVLYAVLAQAAFDGGTIVPVAAPALALFLGFIGTLGVAYATDVRDRRHLRAAFARFVPPEVVDEVVAQAGEELRLGGTRLESTVMFCDLRSFTTTAEQLPAERVIELLNRYLTEMSDAILDHGGTVVAYMGDGIMAVFGAPLHQPDHADNALAAAHDMLTTSLGRFNAWAAQAGIDEPFAIGIGICTGPVMSGNVGSARRLEYAAVGDTTNTAARLQAMTKDAGCPILIAGATRRALVRDAAEALRRVGELEVRGRSAHIEAWTFDDGTAGEEPVS